MGDIVMATAMIRCVRKAYPLAQIDMVVRADFLDLIRDNPHLDRKLTIDRKEGLTALWRLRREINRQHYDLVYDAHRSLRTRLLLPTLQCVHKVTLKKGYFKRTLALLFKWKKLIRGSKRMLERFIEPLHPWGVSFDGLGPEIFPSPELSLDVICHREGIDPTHSWVGIIPSAQWPGKRWAPEHFRTVLKMLLQSTPDKFLIFGGPSDTFCKSIATGLPKDRVINLQGRLSLLEVFTLFQRVKACIANDTGLMHIADAMGIPNVLIFGPTNADMGCLPFQPKSHIVEKTLWCRPCSKNGQAWCIRSKRWCLELITPEEVASSAQHLLRELSLEGRA